MRVELRAERFVKVELQARRFIELDHERAGSWKLMKSLRP